MELLLILFLFLTQVNDTDLHSKLKKEYRKREQELMMQQLRKDPKTIPRPSRDDMMQMVYDSHKVLEKDYSKEFKSLWVTNALDGSEDYLVSETIYKLVGAKLIEFRENLMKTPSPKNLKQLAKIITPPKGVKRKESNTKSSEVPFDEGDELFDCEGEEIQIDEKDGNDDFSDDEETTAQSNEPTESTESQQVTEANSIVSVPSIPKLANSSLENHSKLYNDANFIDKMGQLLLKSTTSNRLGPSVRNIQRQYVKARRNVKEQIRIALSANNSFNAEPENIDDNDNGSESDGNIFDFIKHC